MVLLDPLALLEVVEIQDPLDSKETLDPLDPKAKQEKMEITSVKIKFTIHWIEIR